MEGKETAAEYERRVKGLQKVREEREKAVEDAALAKLKHAKLDTPQGIKTAEVVLAGALSEDFSPKLGCCPRIPPKTTVQVNGN